MPPFTDCRSETNNTQVDNAKYIDIVMAIFNLIEWSNNYSKTSGSLWQYFKDVIIMVILLILMGLMLLIHLILKQK